MNMNMNDIDSINLNNKTENSKIGVTQSIRNKLNFNDEKLWKKFSARRLELIDTLDLSSKKASEQDDDIRKVSETLRTEFGYSNYYINDFDKLVRAAIQSVRRNRKRSSKSRINTNNRFVFMDNHSEVGSPLLSPQITPTQINSSIRDINKLRGGLDVDFMQEENETSDSGNVIKRQRFISEITRLNSDSGEDFDHYSKKISNKLDNSKLAINSIITPKFLKKKNQFYNSRDSNNLQYENGSNSSLILPSISTLTLTASTTPRANKAKDKLLSYIERSKTCQESITKHTPNLEKLGENILTTTISFVFEKFFSELNLNSIDYLRSKLLSKISLSKLFKSLDNSTNILNLSEQESCVSLYILIGGCIKDFGFDCIIYPLSEIFHEIILRDYPLISNQIGMKGQKVHGNSISEEIINVKLKCLKNYLNFTYSNRSSPPKLIELIENGMNAFKILSSSKIHLKDLNSGLILNNDTEIEKIFKVSKKIEFELIIVNSEILHNEINVPNNSIDHISMDLDQMSEFNDHTENNINNINYNHQSEQAAKIFNFKNSQELQVPKINPFQLPTFQPLL